MKKIKSMYYLLIMLVFAILLTACSSTVEEKTMAPKIEPTYTSYSKDVGYVGSEVCSDCHADDYATWNHQNHATSMQLPTEEVLALVDFTKLNNALEIAEINVEDITYVFRDQKMGKRDKMRLYTGDFREIPTIYNIETGGMGIK